MAIATDEPGSGFIVRDMVTDEDGQAKELLASLKKPGREYTVIPTSGIAVGGRMYLHYMSVRDWKGTSWGYRGPAVNGAGFAFSDDGGQSWVKDESARWTGETSFTQAAMVEDEGHIYVFGTPAGRFGPAKLLRTTGDRLLDPGSYEYWSGSGWVSDAATAAEVVPAPVGELSVRWSPYHERWLMMYLNDVTHNIVLRTAEKLEGPWDAEQVVVRAREFPTLYAPFMLPQISGPDIYFTMSLFNVYNVFLVRMRVEKPALSS
jgi:hypothetical protein